MAKGFFEFKKFRIEQNFCAMKVNTDACILGAVTPSQHTMQILDIGTGTGVLALMLAQKSDSKIDAVEIDHLAAREAKKNFENSLWNENLRLFEMPFQTFCSQTDVYYDLIVSNPPYFQNSLKSTSKQKNLARHSDSLPFEELLGGVKQILLKNGLFVVILPIVETENFLKIAFDLGFCLEKRILIKNFADQMPYRQISFLGFEPKNFQEEQLVIYAEKGLYTENFRCILKDYYLHF